MIVILDMIDDMLIVNRAQSMRLTFKPELIDVEQFCRDIFDAIKMLDADVHQMGFVSYLSNQHVRIDSKLLQLPRDPVVLCGIGSKSPAS